MKHSFAPNHDLEICPLLRRIQSCRWGRQTQPGKSVAITTSTNVTETFDYMLYLISTDLVVDHEPDHLQGEAGAGLGVAHHPDVVTPHLQVVDPRRELLREPPREPRHPELVAVDVVADEVVGGHRREVGPHVLLLLLGQLLARVGELHHSHGGLQR